MRYLGLGLIAEGPTDERFLAPLLRRATVEACLSICRAEVVTSDVIPLGRLRAETKGSLTETIVSLVKREAGGSIHLVFVHTDGAGDPERARRERFDPVQQQVIQVEAAPRLIPVIPIRETEAWLLVDGDALRDVLGSPVSNAEMGLPKPGQAESEGDPKKSFEALVRTVFGPRFNRRRHQPSQYLDALGERVGLAALRSLPAYRHFENGLREVLRELC